MRNPNGSTPKQTAKSAATSGKNEPDIEQLAAKVYQLMLKDARLEQARGATRRARK